MANKPNDFNSRLSFPAVTIPSGQTESAPIQLSGSTLCGVLFPGSFDGATLEFSASVSQVDGVDEYFQMHKLDGSAESIPVVLDGNVLVDFQAFSRVNLIKLVATSVQGSDRDLVLMVRSYI